MTAALAALFMAPAVARADAKWALPACAAASAARPMVRAGGADSALVALYQSGQAFPDFLAATRSRREGWLRLADSAQVAPTLIERARKVGGSWRLLVVAVDACGDSMNTVPWLARLISAVPGLDMRIVSPADGKAVQQAHRSLDGRTATPTFVLLDAAGAERGCIVEQPRALREWSTAARASVSLDSVHAGIRAFYARNAGEAITTEFVEMLEAAAAGRTHCDRGTAR